MFYIMEWGARTWLIHAPMSTKFLPSERVALLESWFEH